MLETAIGVPIIYPPTKFVRKPGCGIAGTASVSHEVVGYLFVVRIHRSTPLFLKLRVFNKSDKKAERTKNQEDYLGLGKCISCQKKQTIGTCLARIKKVHQLSE